MLTQIIWLFLLFCGGVPLLQFAGFRFYIFQLFNNAIQLVFCFLLSGFDKTVSLYFELLTEWIHPDNDGRVIGGTFYWLVKRYRTHQYEYLSPLLSVYKFALNLKDVYKSNPWQCIQSFCTPSAVFSIFSFVGEFPRFTFGGDDIILRSRQTYRLNFSENHRRILCKRRSRLWV